MKPGGTRRSIDPKLCRASTGSWSPSRLIDAPQGDKLAENIRLDPKDQPILLAGIHARADYLLTGDARHFGHLYRKRIEGLLVLRPAAHLSAGDAFEATVSPHSFGLVL
jgi:hypothetical protein